VNSTARSTTTEGFGLRPARPSHHEKGAVGHMLRECPHCYTRVVPLPDSRCPACQKNVLEGEGADRKLTSMVVHESLALPNYCYFCDAPTTRFVTIKRSLVKKGENLVVRLLLAGFWIWSLLFTGSTRLRAITIRLPQCSKCAARGKPEPRHVDFERLEMTFVVNRSWRERLRSSKK
jgi:hypothetical protein